MIFLPERSLYSAVVLCALISLFCLRAAGQSYCLPGRFDEVAFTSSETITTSNIPYGVNTDWEGNNVVLRFDVYEPDPTVDPLPYRPLILYTHGGGLEGGSKSNVQAVFWGKRFARAGYVFASIDYRVGWNRDLECTGDTTRFKLALYRATQDMNAAARYLMEYADLYRIDTNQIYLMGNSAGAAVSQVAANYREGDFSSFVRDSLGALDSSSNTFYNHKPVFKGIISKAPGLDKLEVLERSSIPQLLFHGTCDLTVPYDKGRLYWCYTPNAYPWVFGSRSISAKLAAEGTCHMLYTNQYAGHGAVEPDTLLHYGLQFLKDLLCDACASESITRIWPADVCSNNAEEVGVLKAIFPNPVTNQLNIQLAVSQPGDVLLKVFDQYGNKVIHQMAYALPPETVLSINTAALEPGVHVLILKADDRWENAKFLKLGTGVSY